MVESTNKAGVGSIWNKGNWHWEEKNYTEFAKEELKRLWCSIVMEEADAKIEIYEIKELKGAASVTIRKQKQIFMYEFEGEVYWKAKCTKANDDRSECQGKLKVHEFNQEDDEDDFSTEVTCEKSNPWVDGVKNAMRKQVSKRLHSEACKLTELMKAKDIDEIRLAQKQAEAKAAAEAYKEAEEKSGDVKQEIALKQKEKEEEMKKAEAMKLAAQPKKIDTKPAKIEGTGSVWNTNSYHWEEKSVGKWSEDTLTKIVTGFKYTWNDVDLKITEVESLKGEASVSIRKGKKIISYEYEIKLKWELGLKDADGKVVSSCTGRYEMPEVSSDDPWKDWEVRVVVSKDDDNLQSAMNQAIRTLAPEALKKQIQDDFVDVLQTK